MEGAQDPCYESADRIREWSRELDQELLALVDDVRPEELREDPGTGKWRIDQNLAHLSEFPEYFARQLTRWIEGDQVVLGRTAEASAERNDPIVRAGEPDLETFRRRIRRALESLEDALAGLRDQHIDAVTENVKYGQEPLRNFLHRYCVGHKATHVRQLRETIEAVRGRGGGDHGHGG